MEKRILGRTGFEVTVLGMGGVGAKSETVRRALELGVNYVDTAPGYGNSEENIGIGLEGASQSYYIATKLGGRPKPFDAQDKDMLRRSVDESLRLLKRNSIDILQIHEPDHPSIFDWWTDYDNFHGPVCEVLEELKEEKIIKFTGLAGTSSYELTHIMATGNYDVVLAAGNYNLVRQEFAISGLPEAKKQNMGIVIGAAFFKGLLARRDIPELENGARWLSPPRLEQFKKLYAFVDEIGLPLAEVALRWVISNPNVSTVLMGTGSIEEVEQNVAAAKKGPLPPEILSGLKEIADMVPFRPHLEPHRFPIGQPYKGPKYK